MTEIAIIGAGWLGAPLAQQLTKQGHSTIVTKQSQDGLDSLDSLSGFVCNLSDRDSASDLVFQLKRHSVHTVIGAFPPGFRKGKREEYVDWWKTLVEASLSAGVKKLVMVSSTTVYPSVAEVMTEEKASYELARDNSQFSDKARLMLLAEKQVIDSTLKFAIVRLSGLFGPQRNPARFISKLKAISRLAPVNMLHLDDAINATIFAGLSIDNEVINVTTPNTVSKAEFYSKAAEISGLKDELPEFVDVVDKQISPSKLLKLGYHFHHQHVFDGLNAL
ncbi:NAD-dependent epimerase/dehydratase family protein [Vibrio sp. HN007]|uniref:NAD-dependent epimerase/dehydratase family protein n=1 Tax=Vibrio iocasae TaxID=3098914 RepID=UPI0035D4943E